MKLHVNDVEINDDEGENGATLVCSERHCIRLLIQLMVQTGGQGVECARKRCISVLHSNDSQPHPREDATRRLEFRQYSTCISAPSGHWILLS